VSRKKKKNYHHPLFFQWGPWLERTTMKSGQTIQRELGECFQHKELLEGRNHTLTAVLYEPPSLLAKATDAQLYRVPHTYCTVYL
jgi:hypothetical protein